MFRTVIIAFLVTTSVALSGCSKKLEPVSPVQEIISVRGENVSSLQGWTYAPADWSDRRIVYRQNGYESARSLVSDMDELDEITRVRDFRRALRIAMRAEGVRDVQLLERREIEGTAADAFQQVLNAPDARFFVWIAKGKSDEGRVKAAGISVVTRQSDDPGTSMEFFLATQTEYEHLGGVGVPMARFLNSRLTTDPLAFGRQSNDDAVEVFADQLEAYMLNTSIAQARRGLIEGETLNILLGLGQIEPYGLQDPMYDF